MKHRVDPATMFCTGCGAPLEVIADSGDYECPSAGNVVAVSHIITRRRLDELVASRSAVPPVR